jgi:hypothetical protein
MRRRVAFAVALGCLLLGAGRAHAAQPGASIDFTWGVTRSDIDRETALLRAAHVPWVRMTVPWDELEPDRPGRLDARWVSDVDYAVARLRRAGVGVIATLADRVPYWASADPSKRRGPSGEPRYDTRYRPSRFADYARFAGWVAARYGPRGVHVYEIWNEPNLRGFWPSGPDPREYAHMLVPASAAVRRGDPSATVLNGGLAQSDARFLAGLYAAGAGRTFDAVAVHSYPAGDPRECRLRGDGRGYRDQLCGLRDARRVMEEHGDEAKPVWVTELGWSTARPGGVSEREQARLVAAAMRLLASDYPWVTVASVFNLRNDYWMRDEPSSVEGNFGLVRTDFGPKPAYSAIKAYASERWLSDAWLSLTSAAGAG